MPPLHQRQSNVAALAEHFLETLSAKNGWARPRLAAETLPLLEGRPWHGNIRELRNALEHAMILARGGPILPEHLPPPTPPGAGLGRPREAMLASLVRDWVNHELQGPAEVHDLYQRMLQIVEPPLLQAVLQRNGGQFLAAARELGLHRVTLRRKVDSYSGREGRLP